ncbi:GXWXG domain-containing protein [Rhizobium sp.]|uniref:GXWXG domain-containing protein n=1 Tax=Rhizobium sp. TaxID=391 RepID=UPI00289BF45A
MTTPKTSDTQERTLAWFRVLEPVNPAEMIGLWKGSGYPSDHPLDGVLENLGWFGKRFHSDLRADALLFERAPGKLIAIEPAYFPIGWILSFAGIGRKAFAPRLFSHITPRLGARGTTAVLQSRMDDKLITAAMVYDRQPIVDIFRRSKDGQIMGKMIVNGDPRHYFFKLAKVVGATSPMTSF